LDNIKLNNDKSKNRQSLLEQIQDKPRVIPTNNIGKAFKKELISYNLSDWQCSDKDLRKKYGPLLFFKENEKEFPILCTMAKAIFCVMPASTAVESLFSHLNLIQTKTRNRIDPLNLENIAILRTNRI